MNLVWSATPGVRTASVDAGTISSHFQGNDDGVFVLTVFCLTDEAFWQIEYGPKDHPAMLLTGESPDENLALLDVTIALLTRVRDIVVDERAHGA